MPENKLKAHLQEIFKLSHLPSPAPPKPKTPKLGTLGKEDWLDLSDYVVHFARGEKGYGTMMSILWSQVIKRGPNAFGCAVKQKGLDPESQRAVCFSETPLGFLHRLVKRRGTSYGIGFSKTFILNMGGAPLWYLQLGTPQQKLIREIMKGASSPFDSSHPIWQLTPFIDFPSGRPFTYDFRWEREWRVCADVRFGVEDVAFLFLPEHNHEAARGFFQAARDENTGPAYLGTYIDPSWKVEKVAETLKAMEQKVKSKTAKKNIKKP